ncbi:MAG TPA: DUF1206 domain-containing protein [Acidimicrobiales bacterium]|nr:DUF1206 domain-containing protein [Acidimicrobiales bacterium]
MSAVVEGLGRAGLAARGAMYIVVASVAAQIALGDRGPHADREGALAAVARQPMGRLLVAILALGFLAHAGWRLVEAVIDPGDEGTDATGLGKRAGQVARAGIYLTGFVIALPYVTGAKRNGGGGSGEQDLTARVLGWPGGRLLVAMAGAGFLAAAGVNGWRAATGKFRRKLDTRAMPGWIEMAVTWLGRVGMTARLVAWGLIGGFIIRAALRTDPHQAVGLDGALRRLADRPAGPALLLVTAAGLLSFGLYSCCEARWREVEEG